MRPFRHLEIFWVTFRKIQHQIDKNSKTSIILVTWEKHLGSSVFQQGCWICNQCVHLNNLKPSNFQTIAKVFVTMSKKMFGLRKTIFGSDFKTALFSAGECFEKKTIVYRNMCTFLRNLQKLDAFHLFLTLSDDFSNVCVEKLPRNFFWTKKYELLIFSSI